MKNEHSDASMNGRPDGPAGTEGSAKDEDELRLIFYLNEDSDDPRALRDELDHYCDQVNGEAEPIRSERIARCIRALWARRWAGWSGSGTRRATSNTALTHEQWTELSRQALGPSHGQCGADPDPAASDETRERASGASQRASFPIQKGDDFQSPAGADAFPATGDHRPSLDAGGGPEGISAFEPWRAQQCGKKDSGPDSVDSNQTSVGVRRPRP